MTMIADVGLNPVGIFCWSAKVAYGVWLSDPSLGYLEARNVDKTTKKSARGSPRVDQAGEDANDR